jgi:hypothetical protein
VEARAVATSLLLFLGGGFALVLLGLAVAAGTQRGR